MSFPLNSIPNCVLWLDANDILNNNSTYLNNSTIGTWFDKSGLGNNLSGAGSPIYLENPSRISLNGINQRIGGVAGTDLFSTFFTAFFVYKQTSLVGNLWAHSSQPITGIAPNDNGYLIATRGNSVALSSLSAAFPLNQINLLTLNYTANLGDIFVWNNSSNVLTTTQTNSITRSQYNLGFRQSINLYTEMELYEVAHFNRNLTSLERNQVESYLYYKWNIPGTLDSSNPYANFPPTSLTIQQSTEVNLVNSAVQPGTIPLPPVSSFQGRILTFKDSQGTWGQSTFTLSTVGAFDKFEDGTNVKTFQNLWGSTTLYGGTNNRWFIIGGTQYAYGTTNRITTSSIQASAFYANQFPVSTITFQNSLSPLNVSTSLLYYGSTILGPAVTRIPTFIRVSAIFNYTGADQTYVVPDGVSLVRVYMWGAGGGGGRGYNNGTSYGGSAAYVEGILAVTPGETLTIVVGEGGKNIGNPPRTFTGATYGGGGAPGFGTANGDAAGQGGGRSAIRRAGVDIVTAGGGGGGGANDTLNSGGIGGLGTSFASGAIETTATRGNSTTRATTQSNGQAGGGSTTVGGDAGVGISGNGTAGSQYTGGAGYGPGTNRSFGGGGGGGYYGGGGGGGGTAAAAGGRCGGGGSSFLDNLTDITNSASGLNTILSGRIRTGGMSSLYYESPIGMGGSTTRSGADVILSNLPGGDGRVVIVEL